MSDNKTLGKKIIEAAGGAENIKSITNCATRLRMYIKDASKYDEESIKKIDGVMGTSIVGDQYQVIVGPKAIHLCKAIQDEYGIAGAGKKQEKAKGNIVNRFLETVSGCIAPLVPALAASGLIGVSADLLKVAKTKKTELLFLALFIRMLKIGGRCACIVPDGVLFGSSTAHKAIRKALVEENRLEAVISMPSGVFKPYAGVSTAILIFTKTGHGGTDKVWFYDMKADGFSLDDKRTETKENDIPDIIERFRNLDKEIDRKRTEQSFFVPKEEIAENGYDLSINKYKEIEYVPVEYPSTQEIMTELHEIEMKIGEEMQALEELLGLK